jgi:hypothetical protein
MGSVTEQVDGMSLVCDAAPVDFLQQLFMVPPVAILGSTPTKPAAPTAASPAALEGGSQVLRLSTRNGAAKQGIPVAQRAILRIAKELDVVTGEDQSADKAAAALVERFKEPLKEMDIDGLAILTRLDKEAIHRAASQAGASRAVASAN